MLVRLALSSKASGASNASDASGSGGGGSCSSGDAGPHTLNSWGVDLPFRTKGIHHASGPSSKQQKSS